MDTKHTPTPWTKGKRKRHIQFIDGEGWWGLAKVYVRMEGADDDSADGLANLDLIIRAVNWHEEALAALQRIAAQVENGQTLSGTDCAEIASAALAEMENTK